MPSRRTAAVLAAGVLLTAPVVVAPAVVTPVVARAAEAGDRTEVAVPWQGRGGQRTLDGSLLGARTVVPGDAARTVVAVRNDGPTGGTLTVSIVNARLLGGPAAADDGFADDLRINDVPASVLLTGDTVVHETPVARGAVAEVPLHYELPAHATSGNREDAVSVAFDVRLHISGDATDDSAPSDPGTDRTAEGVLARTGGRPAADVRGLLAGAGVLLVAAAVAARRRRRGRAEHA